MYKNLVKRTKTDRNGHKRAETDRTKPEMDRTDMKGKKRTAMHKTYRIGQTGWGGWKKTFDNICMRWHNNTQQQHSKDIATYRLNRTRDRFSEKWQKRYIGQKV